jgi:hypothetical protein
MASILTIILIILGGSILTIFFFGAGITLMSNIEEYDGFFAKMLKSGIGMLLILLGLITIVIMLVACLSTWNT